MEKLFTQEEIDKLLKNKVKAQEKIIVEFCEMIELVGCPQDYHWLYTEACKLINRNEI